MQTEFLNNGILKILLDRPDALNALNETVRDELRVSFEKAKIDPTIKAILITGNGKAFCAGADIKELANTNAQTGLQFAKLGQDLFRLLETLGKPSLAAVNGYAFGGGCELAMACTIRLASTNAQFGQPEVKLGVIPGFGGTQRLARLVGKGRALDLCLSGRFIDAQTAENWGLTTGTFEPDTLLDKAIQQLETIIAMGPLAVKAVIDVIDRGFDAPLDDAFDIEAQAFSMCCGSEDKNEGTHAFIEKRPAEFKGN